MKCPECHSENLEDSRFCSKCATPLPSSEEISIPHTKTIQVPTKELAKGSTFVGRYEVIEEIGRGGMGVVYKANDTKLKRTVALKFLPPEFTRNEEARERFVREAQAAAALDHTNICTVYEVDEAEEKTFISMAYIEGQSLREKIEKGPLELDEALDIAIQVAEGLEEAHKKGVVHRDIKSANIMVTGKGQAKIMDFGLAKVAGGSLVTKEGTTLGTVAYMSPEQAQGEPVDHRSDIWSLGVVLFEILTGQLPFKGDRETSIMYSIVHEAPKSLTDLSPDIPTELEQIISRALNKKKDSRFSSSAEMFKELKQYQAILRAPEVGIVDFKSFLKKIRQPRIAVPAILVVLVLSFFAVRFFNRSAKIRWAREQAIPEIEQYYDEENYTTALQLALQAEKYISEDPVLSELWPKISRNVSIETTPSGADIHIREYKAVDKDWEYLGQSPIESKRIPRGFFRWKIEKQGFEKVERAAGAVNQKRSFKLDEEASIPNEMIRIPGGQFLPNSIYFDRIKPVQLEGYLIDKYEVTNKKFKEFIDSGGYQKREYWKHPFVKQGRILSWEEAMTEFHDATGRPGPSTWEVGSYPEGQNDYPVAGVSWYEAVAYAEFVGKSIPTIYHWYKAAGTGYSRYIIPLSNFGNRSVARVGTHQGMNPYGTYNMAGNVREWCWNELGNRRYIQGGSYRDPNYKFFNPYTEFPFDRSQTNGFRCVKYLSEESIPETAKGQISQFVRDFSKDKPVNDDIFKIIKGMYSYDKTELNPEVEFIDESSKYWIKEKITFDAAYGNERMISYLFIPKNNTPPYQTVIYFPGATPIYLRSSENLSDMRRIDYIIQSGRALLYPVYKSTYERGDGFNPDTASVSSIRDHVIKWIKDIQRSIDYLESRKDIDIDKLGYCGCSWGAAMGSVIPAVENRIKVGILELGGFYFFKLLPETDQINFVPRITIPILMLNGRYDRSFPVKTSQKPMFRLLGSPEEHKRHVIYETGHGTPRNKRIKEVLDWLDRYLGPVK